MFKKLSYAALTAMLVLVGYLNFATPASAVPPVAFDDTVSIDLGTVNYRTVNPTYNDTDVEDVLDFNNIDLDPSTPGIQTSFTILDGTWYVVDPNGFYASEVLFQPNDFYFHSTTTVQYVTVDGDGDVSNIATITLGSYYQAPTVSNLFSTGVDGERISLLWSNFASMPGGATTDNLDLDPLTPGQQSTSTTPLGVFTHLGGYIIFQSTNGLTGVATTTYQVFNLHDGQPSNIGEVTVTINPNTPPVANDYTYGGNIYPDQEINFYASDLGIDPDQGSFFYVSAVDLDLALSGFQNELTTPEGSWTIANNDPFGFSLYFRAAANFLGTALFPFRLRDNSDIVSNIATVTINVVNDAPLAVNDSVLTGTGVPLSINVFGNDDPLGGTLVGVDLDPNTAGVDETSTSTPEGTFTVLVDKKVLFTPAPLFVGMVSVPYVAVDSFGERSIPANIQVDVRDIPILQVKIGMVGSSNVNTTFSPVVTGPVAVTPLPANTCPAFAGTINSAQLALQNFESDIHVLSEGEAARGVVVLENIGSAEAYTMRQRTTSPISFSSNSVVCVIKGDGTVLVEGVDYNSGGDIGVIQFLNTPAATLGDGSVVDGSNAVFIIFDVTPDSSLVANYFLNIPFSISTVTEAVSDVANGPDAFNGLSPYKDEARIFPRRLGSTLQTINASSTQLTTNVSSLTIGEIITYRTEIEVPELSTLFSPSTFRDTFAPGLFAYDNNGLQNPIRVTVPASIIDPNTLGPLSTTSQVLSGGNEIEVVFDALYNTDTDISTVESIVIEYDVIVSDSVLNLYGGLITNDARHIVDTSYPDPSCGSECAPIFGTVTNRAATSTQVIVEPALVLRSVSATTTNASSTAQFIFELFHDGMNTTDAQDVVFYLQTNGPGLVPINISNVQVTGLAPATTTIGSLFLSWPSIPATFTSSSPITIAFLGTLVTPATATTTLLYPVGLTSWSVPGGSLVPLSSFSPLSHARTYSGTSTLGTMFVPSGVLPPPSTSTPTTTLGCIGSCGGSFNNPGCTDPKALNYDNWATVNNGSCTYAVATSTTTPTIAPVSTSTPPTVPPIVAPGSTSSPITYIPKAKRQLILQLTGPLEALQTRLRKDALKVALSEGNAITIPHIGTKKPVLQLPNLDPLLNEFWMLPWGSTPEKGNNTILVAHSYNQQKGKQWPNVLFNLDKVKVGEKITFDWQGKTYTYEVVDNKQFDAKDVYIEDDTKESVLTIYGCGKYTTKYRQVVRALLVSVE